MSVEGLGRALLLLALACFVFGCASARLPVGTNGLSSFAVWSEAGFEPTVSADGHPVDLIRVRGGDVVRVHTRNDDPVQVAERIASGLGFAESWSERAPENSVLVLRASAFAGALLLPHGVAVRVYRGHGSDPGYEWFGLEDRVLEWANGPLPAAFPSVAPRERIDFEGFAALDEVLVEALARCEDREPCLAAARAVRAVAGLRAIRALRPPVGLPYFLDTALRATPEVEATLGSHPAYVVGKGRALELPVTGPGILHVWAQAAAGAVAAAELNVLEGASLRGRAQLSASRSPLTSRDAPVLQRAAGTSVRRALVHVPPGLHRYRIESTADLVVAPLLAEPVVHVEEAAQKDEASLLTRAYQTCTREDAAPLCALTLALLGMDTMTRPSAGAGFTWTAALGRSSVLAQRVAKALASGGPRDPTQDLDASGTAGDPKALARLARSVSQSVDEGARSAWVHALAHGTEWRVAGPDSGGPAWLAVASDDVAKSGECRSNGLSDAAEVAATEAEYQTENWYGVPALELLVVSQCSDPRPIELVIDGERLVGNPSSSLVRWRVRVRGELARVSRSDHSSARVFALRRSPGTCRNRWEALRPPMVVGETSVLHLGTNPGEAGLELWLRDGATRAEIAVMGTSGDGRAGQSVHLVVPRATGFAAYDANGVTWTRVARVPLPSWASGSVRLSGGSAVAVRALVRATRGSQVAALDAEPKVLAPLPLDEAALAEVARRILARPPQQRGALYLERALMLAASGARGGALADARAAQQLGAHGPHGEDPLPLVLAAIRRVPIATEPMPDGVNAYGIDSDFEPGAKRCEVQPGGARAELERLFAASNQATRDGLVPAQFDEASAAHALALRDKVPFDPRAARLVARALAGSRWKLRPQVGEAKQQRVRRAFEARRDGPVDAEGELRPRVLVGGRFAPGSYATVLPLRPAKATLSAIPADVRVTLEFACGAREPALARSPCPVAVLFDDVPLPVKVADDGRSKVELPKHWGLPRRLAISLRDEPGQWLALVRLLVDRALPNTIKVDDGHWVITPPLTEWRTVIKEGMTLVLEPVPALLRVDARAESETPTQLVLAIAGEERIVPANGSLVVVPLIGAGAVTLTARGGPLSVALAERVSSEPAPDQAEVSAKPKVGAAGPLPVAVRLTLDVDRSGADDWFQLALRSPPPLTPVQELLGTAVAETGVVLGKLRKNELSSVWADAYVFNLLGYRRRIESLGLWTRVEAFSRARPGEPTYGLEGSLYEDLERAHVRVSASLKAETEQVAGMQAKSLMARGFVEYSYRAAQKVFVLPRLGYDGMYSSVARRPTSLAYVDDEIYSPYRARRPTFLFAQALLWYTPYFNEILYLRLRGTFDAKARALSHSAAVLGAFVAFGDLDLSAEAQTVWYVPRDALSNRAHGAASTGASARYSFWSGLGSLAISPGIAAVARPQDASWQVTGFVNVCASFRRGLRDFSSLELDFPEQLGGGIPWRGSTPGGYR